MVDRLTGTRALTPLATPARPAVGHDGSAAPAAARRMAGDALSLRGREPLAATPRVDLERIDVPPSTMSDMILDYVDGIRNMLLGINQTQTEKKDEKLEEAHKKLKKLMEAAIASGDLSLLVQLRTLIKTIVGKMAITDPQVADFKELQAEVLKAIEAIREKTGLLKFHQDTWQQTVARSGAGGAAPTA